MYVQITHILIPFLLNLKYPGRKLELIMETKVNNFHYSTKITSRKSEQLYLYTKEFSKWEELCACVQVEPTQDTSWLDQMGRSILLRIPHSQTK